MFEVVVFESVEGMRIGMREGFRGICYRYDKGKYGMKDTIIYRRRVFEWIIYGKQCSLFAAGQNEGGFKGVSVGMFFFKFGLKPMGLRDLW